VQFLRERASEQVGSAAGCEGHDQSYWFVRVLLSERRCCPCQREHDRPERCCDSFKHVSPRGYACAVLLELHSGRSHDFFPFFEIAAYELPELLGRRRRGFVSLTQKG